MSEVSDVFDIRKNLVCRGIWGSLFRTDQPQPNCLMIKRYYDNLTSTGCVKFHDEGFHYKKRESMPELVVTVSIELNLWRRTYEMACETGLSKPTVVEIIQTPLPDLFFSLKTKTNALLVLILCGIKRC